MAIVKKDKLIYFSSVIAVITIKTVKSDKPILFNMYHKVFVFIFLP